MKTEIQTLGGSIAFEPVPFDTELFGFEVARVADCSAPTPEALVALHAAAVEKAAAAGYKHISRRVGATDYAEIVALERAGYMLLDVGVIFDHDLKGIEKGKWNGARAATEKDVERVVAECAGIFRGSRYYHDPAFNDAGADELHRRWIWNCFKGRADVILVLDDPTAFVTCAVDKKTGHGNIALFGVSPNGQGKGSGQRLLGASLSWFAEHATKVDVKTQATNYAAARMYEKGGFRLCKGELTYGRRLGT
ncbi:MAG: GNAT family N-acetyltransferase [Polyangiaceae bacterium]